MTDETRTIEDVEIVEGITEGEWERLDVNRSVIVTSDAHLHIAQVYKPADAKLVVQAKKMQQALIRQHERIEEYRNALEEIAYLVITGHNAKATLARIALSLSGMEDAGMIHPERQHGAEASK